MKSPNNNLRTSQQGIDLIKSFEGLRLEAYADPAHGWKVPTIGYGHTKTAKRGMKITKNQAESLLREDLISYENAVKKYVSVRLEQYQFDALVSFTYNCGPGNLLKSSLLRNLNNMNYPEAANGFLRYVYAAGRRLKGLVRRREAEAALFRKGTVLMYNIAGDEEEREEAEKAVPKFNVLKNRVVGESGKDSSGKPTLSVFESAFMRG